MRQTKPADRRTMGASGAQDAVPTADGAVQVPAAHEAIVQEWRSKYASTDAPYAARLAELEDENRHLKKRLAEAMLDIATLREMLAKTV